MTGHLFLGGPAHGEWHYLPGSPQRWEFAVYGKMPVSCFRPSDEPDSFTAVDRFGYEPRVLRKATGIGPPMTATVYVPAHLSEDLQWELVKALGLGEVPEG